MPAVPSPAKVLVSGASGFLGAHVARELLEKGYTVVGTVRSDEKGKYLQNLFQNFGSKFSYAKVPDIEQDGAFDEVVKSHEFDAVEHTASPFHFKASDPSEFIGPALKGTTGILNSISKYGPNVRRVVITSSVAAIIEPNKAPQPYNFTEADWNEFSPRVVEEKGKEAPVFDWYRASKTLAEKAAWNYVKENKVSFDLVVINPPFIFGPTIHEISSVESLNESNAQFFKYVHHPPAEEVATRYFGNSVDVRDVATAHALALENPQAGGERFITSAGPFAFQQIYNELRKAGVADIKAGYPDAPLDPSSFTTQDGSKATRVLGLKYRSLQTQAVDTIKNIRERFPNAEKEDAEKHGE